MTQIDLLNDEISELIRVRDEMEVKLQTTNITPEQNAIQNNIDGLNKTIGEKQAQLSELEKQEKLEEKVHSDIPFAIPGVDLTALPAELIKVIEVVVKADRRRYFAEHAVELEQVEAEAEEKLGKAEAEYESLKFASDELLKIIEDGKAANEALIRDNGNLRDRTHELTLENEDLSSKLSNAAAQIEEKDKEIARLNDQIDDYQKAKVFGERQAQSVIDVTPNEAEEISDAINKFLKSEDWGSVIKVTKVDGNFELVKRADFEANWTPEVPAYPGGSESTGSFPGEAVEADSTDGGISYPAPPSLDFPKNQENAAAGLDGDTPAKEVVGETVTRAEFEALKKRVEYIGAAAGLNVNYDLSA